ncbi:MAG: hypothetical protein CL941_03475 [Desulfobacter sp.]|nr:hypothetical protein [Desulfobacter sp.]
MKIPKSHEPEQKGLIHHELFPSLSDFLSYMKSLKPLNKIGDDFGSKLKNSVCARQSRTR